MPPQTAYGALRRCTMTCDGVRCSAMLYDMLRRPATVYGALQWAAARAITTSPDFHCSGVLQRCLGYSATLGLHSLRVVVAALQSWSPSMATSTRPVPGLHLALYTQRSHVTSGTLESTWPVAFVYIPCSPAL